MVTRLVLCFDGTWNHPSQDATLARRVETNVVRFYDSVLNGKRPDGSVQKRWYDTGVGTNWWDSVWDGVFGDGLDAKIRDGYRFLIEKYPQPDPDWRRCPERPSTDYVLSLLLSAQHVARAGACYE